MSEPTTDPSVTAPRSRRSFKPDRDVEDWHGAYKPYDLIKEFTVAFLAVLLVVVALAVVFSSPDDKPVTIRSWSQAAPVDFAQTAVAELAGTSATAQYGPPYNNNDDGQQLGPVGLAKFVGVHIPIDTATTDVIGPLETLPRSATLDAAISTWKAAPPAKQQSWANKYEAALDKATMSGDTIQVPSGNYGPVEPMIVALTSMARSGGVDGALLSSKEFYGTDYTKPLLFIADGTYLASLAQKQHLSGSQWGMMNETGSYPGQAWLWLYTMWYQIPPFNSSENADVLIWALMILLTFIVAIVPFLPGVRSIPRKVRIYRLIWRQHYQSLS